LFSLYSWPVDGFVNLKSGSVSLMFKRMTLLALLRR
jgi:hypothetical protein